MLVLLPNWVGDAVMATPTLRALRERWPAARIVGVGRATATGVLAGAPWLDELRTIARDDSPLGVGLRLRRERFDTAVLLPNSWRAALIARLSGARRRVGYARDGRGLLLTDRLRPAREGGRYVPRSAVGYYLDLTRRIGAEPTSTQVELPVTAAESDAAAGLLREAGVPASAAGPKVMLIPGASYGEAKRWPADRFAAVADALVERHGATILLSGSPAERGVIETVRDACRAAPIDLAAHGLTLAKLKGVIDRCDLVITNDTGPRHIAAAVDTPVVTIFGPTDPRWSEIDFARERQVRIDVACGPCQRPQCPLTDGRRHQCMTGIDIPMVLEAAEALLGDADGATASTRHMPAGL